MSDVSIDFTADLRQAQQAFAQTASSMRSLSDAMVLMEKTAKTAADRLQRLGDEKERTKKNTLGLTGALGGLVDRFAGIVTVGGAVTAAINFINSATQSMTDRARAGAESLRALDGAFKSISAAAGYGAGQTLALKREALQVGVATKIGPEVAVPAVARAVQSGLGIGAARTALEFHRTTGIDPTLFLDTLDRAVGAGRGIESSDLADIVMQLSKKSGEPAQDVLEMLSTFSGVQGADYDLQSLAGLAAGVSDRLPPRQSRGAIMGLLTALAGGTERDAAPTAEEIDAALRMGVAPRRRRERVAFTGTIAERLAQLREADPERYEQMLADPAIGVAVSAVNAGFADRLDYQRGALRRAVIARGADPHAAALDDAAAMRSAVAQTEHARGAVHARLEAKRTALIAALDQAGASRFATEWKTKTIPGLLTQFGGDLAAVEAAIEQAAGSALPIENGRDSGTFVEFGGGGGFSGGVETRAYPISLDPRRIAAGTAGLIDLGQNRLISAERLQEFIRLHGPDGPRLDSAIDEAFRTQGRKRDEFTIISLRDFRGDDYTGRVNYPGRAAGSYFG